MNLSSMSPARPSYFAQASLTRGSLLRKGPVGINRYIQSRSVATEATEDNGGENYDEQIADNNKPFS